MGIETFGEFLQKVNKRINIVNDASPCSSYVDLMLMNENIDHSVRFERYSLLNHIYSKIYEYSKNIKPAPNPHYILEKFYGNLTIQEYRALLKSHRLYLMIDKPLTRILPEYYDDNDDFIINHKVIPSSNLQQIKKNIRRQPYNDMYDNKAV